MKVSFMTFGGGAIGTGHLFRCLNIAKWIQAFNTDVEIHLHVLDLGIESQLKAIEIIKSRSNYPVSLESANSINKLSFDILIVDLLDVPMKIAETLREKSNFLISIDNVSVSRVFSNININPLYYKIDAKFKIKNDYIGPQFHITSPEFNNLKSQFRKDVKNILVIQGGADPFNLTCGIISQLDFIKKDFNGVKIHVITGPAYIHTKSLLVYKKENNIIFHNNIKKMGLFLKNIDLAISSIGVTAFEIAGMGIPSIHITSIEKEIETGMALKEQGVSVLLGLCCKDDIGHLLKSNVSRLINSQYSRKKMRKNCFKLFNKSFNEKIIKEIIMFNKVSYYE